MLQLSPVGGTAAGSKTPLSGSSGPEGDVSSVFHSMIQPGKGLTLEDLKTLEGMMSPELLAMLQQMLAGGTSLPSAEGNFLLSGEEASGDLLGALLPEHARPGAIQSITSLLQTSMQELAEFTDMEPEILLEKLGNRLQNQMALARGDTQLHHGAVDQLGSRLISGGGTAFQQNLSQVMQQTGNMLTVPIRVGDPGWEQSIGNRIVWLLGRDQQIAELKLNPPNVGLLEVRLSLQHDQASVAFSSAHAGVREALEQALPRLRDMLEQQDIQLVNVDINHRDDPEGSPVGDNARSGNGPAQNAGSEVDEEAVGDAQLPTRLAVGLLDIFV